MSVFKKIGARSRKQEYKEPLSFGTMVIRCMVGIPFMAVGIKLMVNASAADFFFTILPIIIGAILLGAVICQALSYPVGSLFWPGLPPGDEPVYSTAQTCRNQGRYNEAMSHYRQIIAEFPYAFKAHAALIELAAIDMHDPELSRRFLLQAKSLVRDTTKHARLQGIYESACNRYEAATGHPRHRAVPLVNKADTHISSPIRTSADDQHEHQTIEGLL